jgi:hypothetical protein
MDSYRNNLPGNDNNSGEEAEGKRRKAFRSRQLLQGVELFDRQKCSIFNVQYSRPFLNGMPELKCT